MGASLSILVAGLMFGFGLAVSGMTHASKRPNLSVETHIDAA